MSLGSLSGDVGAATQEALTLVPRVWDRDHTVWDTDPTEIADRLGWLEAPDRAEDLLPELTRLVSGIVEDGITDVLLVGMGGSSLYPLVLSSTFGPSPGHPRVWVLDSTDPAAVLEVERELPWTATLLVPASKSGTTLETISHLERFLARLRDAHGSAAGRYVLPITDPGSELDERAAEEGFRGVVHGQVDVGGRYSALTPFGLLPAALLGIDVRAHLAVARGQLEAARSPQSSVNAPAVLGATLAAAVRTGRDKLTLLLPDELTSFGLWIEQLIAESTGKDGTGIVPVLGETSSTATFGDDRLVIAYGEPPELDALLGAGVPVVQLPWDGPSQLAGEVIRFEFATAIAGALLGVNPFDQPDVAAAKEATGRVLAAGDDLPPTRHPHQVLEGVAAGDYIALLGFVTPGGEDEALLERAAQRLRDRAGVPVTVGIGPRYLHSTGQLHKGGPGSGVFLVVVGDDPDDADIPGRDLTFGALKRAQAAGDLEALRAAGRRVAHVTLGSLRDL